MTPEQLNDIEARANAATPGPWGWFGNTDVHTIYLATKKFGRQLVMGFHRWGMNDAQPMFSVGREWKQNPQDSGDFGSCGSMTKASELPVFEVAPSAESRDDERVYRGHLVGVRHPDAVFIAAARSDVSALVAEVKRLKSEVAKSTYCQGPTECIERECEEYYDDEGDELTTVEYCSHLSPRQVTFEDFERVEGERDRARNTAVHLEQELAHKETVWQGERESLAAELAKVRHELEHTHMRAETLVKRLQTVKSERDRAMDAIERVRKIAERTAASPILVDLAAELRTAINLDGSEPADGKPTKRYNCPRCGDMQICGRCEPELAAEVCVDRGGESYTEYGARVTTTDGSGPYVEHWDMGGRWLRGRAEREVEEQQGYGLTAVVVERIVTRSPWRESSQPADGGENRG